MKALTIEKGKLKFSLIIIVCSHLSDVQEMFSVNPFAREKLNFAKWLMIKYREDRLDAQIDADAEWKEFQKEQKKKKQQQRKVTK